MKREYFFILTIALLIATLMFWRFFVKGLYPFPADYMLAWYEPWKSDSFIDGTIQRAHKPILDDVFRVLYSFKVLAADLVKKTEWPLWNPYNGAGQPLMATMHSGFFNPFNAFFLFLSGPLAWSFYIIPQAILIILFTYTYCRSVTISPFGALFSSLSFVFSGFIVVRLLFGEFVYVLAFLPLLLAIIEWYRKNPKTKRMFLIPVIILFMFGSGQPQIILYSLLLTIVYMIYRLRTLPKIALFILLIVLGIGMSAAVLLPTIELAQHANVDAKTSTFIFDRFLLPITHLVTFVIPNYFGNQATYNYWGAGDYIETVAALGSIPVFLAYVGIVLARKRSHIPKINARFFFIFSALFSILATLEWFGTKFLYSLPLPIISTGVPSRIFVLTIFSLSILAGYGFDTWISLKHLNTKLTRRVGLYSLFIGVIIAITAILYIRNTSCPTPFIQNCRAIALRNTVLETTAFSVFLLLSFAYVKNLKPFRHIFPPVIVTIITLLGLYNSYKFLPFSQKETVLPRNPLIMAIQEHTRDARIFGLGEGNVKTDFATFFRFYDPNYFDPLYIKRYGELIMFGNRGKLSIPARSDVEITNEINLKNEAEERRRRLLSLLGVKYLIFKKSELKENSKYLNETVWENKTWIIVRNHEALPRAFFVNQFEIASKKEILLERLFDSAFNPKSKVILEKDILQREEKASSGSATIVDYQENIVLIGTESNANQILVLSDNYYPGWKAFVDNDEVAIYRANYTFRAIVVPSGRHEVRFSYQPSSLRIGLLLSLGFTLFYLLLIIYWKKVYGYKKH